MAHKDGAWRKLTVLLCAKKEINEMNTEHWINVHDDCMLGCLAAVASPKPPGQQRQFLDDGVDFFFLLEMAQQTFFFLLLLLLLLHNKHPENCLLLTSDIVLVLLPTNSVPARFKLS